MKSVLVTAAFLFTLLLQAGAWAETGLPGAQAPNLLAAGIKMIGALALLIGGLLLALHFIKRFASTRRGLFGGQEQIKILATRALAPKKFIAVVEVCGSVLTLGVTNDRISRLDKKDARTFHAGQAQEIEPKPSLGFAWHLKALTGRAQNKTKEEET